MERQWDRYCLSRFILNICEGFLPHEYKPSDKVSNIDEKMSTFDKV